MLENKPLVSIIIVTLNRKDDLINCISSIQSQSYRNYELIIIDNNSNDGTVDIIKKKFLKTKIFKTKKNLGTSYTRNAAVKFSKGDLIWFLDSDAYLTHEKVLETFVNKFKEKNDVSAFGGEGILDESQKIIGVKELKLFPNGMIKGFTHKNQQNNIYTKVLATCNLIIKKKIFLEIGGFDHFYFFYLEDIDLTYRIYKKKFKIGLINNCPVVHTFSKKSRFRNFFKSNRNRIYFLIKNYHIKHVVLLPFFDILYVFNFNSFKRFFKKFYINPKKDKFNTHEIKKNFKINNMINSIYLSTLVIGSMLFSYFYIPYYLINIKKIKKEQNFLELINNDDFIKIL